MYSDIKTRSSHSLSLRVTSRWCTCHVTKTHLHYRTGNYEHFLTAEYKTERIVYLPIIFIFYLWKKLMGVIFVGTQDISRSIKLLAFIIYDTRPGTGHGSSDNIVTHFFDPCVCNTVLL